MTSQRLKAARNGFRFCAIIVKFDSPVYCQSHGSIQKLKRTATRLCRILRKDVLSLSVGTTDSITDVLLQHVKIIYQILQYIYNACVGVSACVRACLRE